MMQFDIFYTTLIGVHIILGTICASHALLYKRDSVAALGWIAVIIGYPLLGPILYFLFGINRTSRQARKQRGLPPHEQTDGAQILAAKDALNISPNIIAWFINLSRLAYSLSERPLTNSNQIVPLVNGDEAFPAMLQAIQQAKDYIFLTTYIFETNATGREFIAALGEAKQRNVNVKVIIDGIGEWYSWPHASQLLKKHNIDVVLFHPPKLWSIAINLRNHRKMLIVDGHTVFTGGMNIGGRHLTKNAKKLHRDIQFQFTGTIVQQCVQIFREDWYYITQQSFELLSLEHKKTTGTALCRAIEDGPNEYLGKLCTLLVNAVSIAQESIWIMTPYFLPSNELTNALQAAALRGIKVNIILPRKNNLPYVKWASEHIFWRLTNYGVNLYYQSPPFTHTKLFVIDEYYTFIGSPNLDPRSLRLNFEMGIEIYDKDFAQKMARHCQTSLATSTIITQQDLEHKNLLKKLRNGICWLFTPYL